MRLDGLLAPRREVAEHQVLEPPVAATADHLGAETDLDVLGRLDLAHQVVRHAGARARSPRTTSVTCRAYRARWSAACPAELAPPTMKTSRPASAGASDVGTAVEHAGAVQRLERRHAEPAVAGAHRQEHGRGADAGRRRRA